MQKLAKDLAGVIKKERAKKKKIIIIYTIFIGITLFGGLSWASWSVPNIFSTGEVLSAGQMNANFTAVRTAVDSVNKGSLDTELTGTVTVTAGLSVLSGNSTVFNTELKIGDSIKIAGEIFTITGIINDTLLTLDGNHVNGATEVIAYKDLSLLKVENGDSQTKLMVDKSGNVGIGTTAPAGKLDVNGTLYSAGKKIVKGNSTENWFYLGTDRINFRTQDNSANLFQMNSNGSFIVINGKIGIGTISPNSELEVKGYLELDLLSGSAPPAGDCDETSERGRMVIEEINGLLYICVNAGWVSK